MKTDLDNLMEARGLDAILVVGSGQHNPPMVYLTGGAHLTNALLVKKRGDGGLLFHRSMERDEAAKTRLQTRNMDDYGFPDLLREAGGNQLRATVKLYHQMLEDARMVEGRVALYGKSEVGSSFAIFSALQQELPGLKVQGELQDSVLLLAMQTKDAAEIERIRRMGQVTTKVVGMVAEFLGAHQTRDGTLVKSDGEPLTVGEVKRRVNLWLAMEGADNPEGCIFAIGRDAGVPHSAGAPDDVLQLGETIVFDIFPCEVGGGYHFDFTRTWCLGYAPEEAQAVYDDVRSVYEQIMSELQSGGRCRDYQDRVCELFEIRGHPTVRSNPRTQEGYVHGLGHGLGLYVHERPYISATAGEDERLDPGVVVTIEPGLYYPERGLGVRLENTVWVRPDGRMEVLADYPLDLVLPVRSG